MFLGGGGCLIFGYFSSIAVKNPDFLGGRRKIS